jgi:hypothetical protein
LIDRFQGEAGLLAHFALQGREPLEIFDAGLFQFETEQLRAGEKLKGKGQAKEGATDSYRSKAKAGLQRA